MRKEIYVQGFFPKAKQSQKYAQDAQQNCENLKMKRVQTKENKKAAWINIQNASNILILKN